jgi:amino acid efflux transporter
MALGEHRLLPVRTTTQARSLTTLAAVTAIAGVVTLARPVGLDPLLRATAACLVAVTFLGAVAAVRLLPAGRARATAVAASVLTGLTLVLSGPYLVVPAAVALAGFAAQVTVRIGNPSQAR